MNPKLWEEWLRWSTQILEGTGAARQAFESLGTKPPSPEELARWAKAWLPAESRPADPGELQEVLERWWDLLGVVPRYRYVELLRRYEELKERLEQAEETVRHLRTLLRDKEGVAPDVTSAVDQWAELTQKALDAQMEWARTWLGTGETGTEGKARPEDKKR
ncbi:hypothetical protein [Deferrisoma sp.]